MTDKQGNTAPSSHVALYRKYRSKSLDEIVGQTHVTDILRREIASGQIAHAYLLTGPRGVGKTSIARILAHEINHIPYTDESDDLDIIEIDAASNNGVDDVRELRDKALIAPARSPKKVYIIDEVHMLSKPAFNALLKILEEPPAHVVFILATTDFDKLPDTIISRTQRYHFHTIAPEAVAAHMATIAKQEGFAITEDALALIAERGGGSLRDSLSLLDQVRHCVETGTEITREHAEAALGLATSSEVQTLLDALIARNAAAILQSLKAIQDRGVGATTLASQLIDTVTRSLATSPHLVHLLEGLMETMKSTYPDTKLLVVLLSDVADTPRPKTIASSAAPTTQVVMEAPATYHKPTPAAKKPKSATAASPATPTPAPETRAPAEPSGEYDLSQFDWQKIVSYAKENFTGVYTLIAKASPEVQDDRIMLYVGKAFKKNKLESANHRPILGKILEATGVGAGAAIEIIGTPPPPKDSQAAAIAAMMGGGEEVDVA